MLTGQVIIRSRGFSRIDMLVWKKSNDTAYPSRFG